MEYKKFFTVLKSLVFTSALMSLVAPQLAVAQSSTRRNLTLSDEVPVRLESRTIEDDYREFFRQRNRSLNGLTNVENYNTSINTADNRWVISDQWRLLVNDPLVEPLFPLPILRNNYDGVDRVEVRYELLEFGDVVN